MEEGQNMAGPKKSDDAPRSDEVIARTHLGTGNRKNPIKVGVPGRGGGVFSETVWLQLLAGLAGQKIVFAEGGEEGGTLARVGEGH